MEQWHHTVCAVVVYCNIYWRCLYNTFCIERSPKMGIWGSG